MLNLYMLVDPTGAETCYIGLSRSVIRRFKEHTGESSGKKTRQWIRMLKNRGLKPALHVLDTIPEKEARQAEKDAISMCRAIRGAHCLNKMS